jgi:hypothetical protein
MLEGLRDEALAEDRTDRVVLSLLALLVQKCKN